MINSVLRIRDVFPGSQFPDPGSWFLPIPGSKNSSKREGWKKIYCHTCFCSHLTIFYFWNAEEKNLGQFSKLFTQKIVTKLSKIWVWDPRSGIRKKPIPDPGIQDPDPQHWINSLLEYQVQNKKEQQYMSMSKSLGQQPSVRGRKPKCMV